MSRLSRFKKAPAVILPTRLTRGRFDDDDDSDNDDFKEPKPLEKKASSRLNDRAEKKNSQSKQTPAVSSSSVVNNSSFSEYFHIPEKKIEQAIDSIEKDHAHDRPAPLRKTKTVAEKKGTSSSNLNPNPEKSTSPHGKGSARTEEDIVLPEDENSPDDKSNPVHCPFCWKKLGDKLTGTTHIKSCAKDLPIEHIHEAMLLQEKQIEEWKKLGLNFPAFSTENKKTKKATSRQPRGRGGRGRKKNEDDDGGVDQQLELAMALSVSLHDELESRKQNENQFLIENGLDKEIGLEEMKSSASTTSATSSFIPPQKATMTKSNSSSDTRRGLTTTTATAARRRGKKLVLNSLPLYTANDLEKKAVIVERVSKILDESMNSEREDFFIRDPLPAEIVGIPKRLQPFQNQECTLWNCAQITSDESKEGTFSVLDLNISHPVGIFEASNEIDSHSPSSSTSHKYLSEDARELQLFDPNKLKLDSSGVGVNVASARVNEFRKLDDDDNVKFKKGISPTSNSSKTGENGAASTIKTNASRNFDRKTGKTTSAKSKSFSHLLEPLSPIVRDVAKMLLQGIDCDMVIYGREEKPIKCHRFMLTARCSKILGEIVVEKRPNRPDRHIIPLTNFKHEVVKAFVWYLYTGCVDFSSDEVFGSLQELGNTYEVKVIADAAAYQHVENKDSGRCSLEAEVQTDVASTTDSCTMTDAIDRGESDKKSTMEVSSSGQSKYSQELFTTFYCESPGIDKDQPIDDDCRRPNFSDYGDEQNDDTASVDLFEDIELSLKTKIESKLESAVETNLSCEATAVLEVTKDWRIDSNLEASYEDNHNSFDKNAHIEELASPAAETTHVPFEKRRSRSISPVSSVGPCDYTNGFGNGEDLDTSLRKDDEEDNNDYFEDLASPSPISQRSQTSCEKKRSRSASPVVDSCLYTATQVANLIQCHQDGGNVSYFDFKKANKKQKLYESTDSMNVNGIDVHKNSSGSSDDCENYKWDLGKNKSSLDLVTSTDLLIDNLNPMRKDPTTTAKITPIRKNVLRITRRSVSTPDLTSKFSNSHSSPFCHQQEQLIPSDEFDPLENACDDSLFAKIPEDAFAYTNDNESSLGKKNENKSTSRPQTNSVSVTSCRTSFTPPGRTQRGSSRRDLSSYSSSDDSVLPVKSGKTKTKGRGKTKEKPKPKVKLPKAKHLEAVQEKEEVVSARQSCSNPEIVVSKNTSQAGNSKCKKTNSSPLLNYSLIDTPVLKQELKRYGIKPLPRSKAKVLLRHIYTKTHESEGT